MTDTLAQEIEQLVQHPCEDVKVEGEQVDEVPQRLNHRRRQPDTHVFVGAESRDVGSGSEDGEDGEEDLLADGVPELGRVGVTVRLERVEQVIQCSVDGTNSVLRVREMRMGLTFFGPRDPRRS